jgi:hypothetical protein
MSEPRGRGRAKNGSSAPARQKVGTGPTASAEPAPSTGEPTSASQPTDTEAPAAEPAPSTTEATQAEAAPAEAPTTSTRPAGTARRAMTIGALVVLGIAGVGGGGALLARNLSHTSSGATAGGQAIATRWQQLPASQIFPATIQYVSAQNVMESAHRVGIAPAASCPAALDSAASAAMANLGCTMALRATYADQSGMLLATVAVAVVASARAAATAAGHIAALRPPAGIRPVPFSGTIADLFQDAQRAALGTPIAAGRYVFFYAAGYADGRPGQSAGDNPDLNSLGQDLVTKVEHVLTGQGTS